MVLVAIMYAAWSGVEKSARLHLCHLDPIIMLREVGVPVSLSDCACYSPYTLPVVANLRCIDETPL